MWCRQALLSAVAAARRLPQLPSLVSCLLRICRAPRLRNHPCKACSFSLPCPALPHPHCPVCRRTPSPTRSSRTACAACSRRRARRATWASTPTPPLRCTAGAHTWGRSAERHWAADRALCGGGAGAVGRCRLAQRGFRRAAGAQPHARPCACCSWWKGGNPHPHTSPCTLHAAPAPCPPMGAARTSRWRACWDPPPPWRRSRRWCRTRCARWCAACWLCAECARHRFGWRRCHVVAPRSGEGQQGAGSGGACLPWLGWCSLPEGSFAVTLCCCRPSAPTAAGHSLLPPPPSPAAPLPAGGGRGRHHRLEAVHAGHGHHAGCCVRHCGAARR